MIFAADLMPDYDTIFMFFNVMPESGAVSVGWL